MYQKMFQPKQTPQENKYQLLQVEVLKDEKEKLISFLNDYPNILKQVDKAVIENNINQLRKLAYQYLNLAKTTFLLPEIRNELYPLLFQNPEDIQQAGSILKNLLASSKINVKQKLEDHDANSIKDLERPAYWNPTGQLTTEKRIKIIHGGGLQYITNFLQGKEIGYKLEKFGRGIQVHPVDTELSLEVNKRARHYAQDRSISSCDFPAILEAEIAVGFLDSANNQYEAGLRSCYISCLSNVKIKIILNSSATPPKELLDELIRSKAYSCSSPTWEFTVTSGERMAELVTLQHMLKEIESTNEHLLDKNTSRNEQAYQESREFEQEHEKEKEIVNRVMSMSM